MSTPEELETLGMFPHLAAPQPPVATPPTATPDAGEATSGWCESMIGRDSRCQLPAGHKEKHRAGYLIWTDREANKPSWPPAAPTTPPPTATLSELLDALELTHRVIGLDRKTAAKQRAARIAVEEAFSRLRSDVEENRALHDLLTDYGKENAALKADVERLQGERDALRILADNYYGQIAALQADALTPEEAEFIRKDVEHLPIGGADFDRYIIARPLYTAKLRRIASVTAPVSPSPFTKEDVEMLRHFGGNLGIEYLHRLAERIERSITAPVSEGTADTEMN